MARRAAFAIYVLVCATIAAFLMTIQAGAVRLTSDADDQQQAAPEPPPPNPPVPPAGGPTVRLIERVTIEGPYSDRGLTVFTLSTARPENHVNYLTLDEGLASGQIVIQEVKGGRVPTLQALINSGRPTFLMAGEVVTGGKQNRTLRSDVLMPRTTSTVYTLPVYCVEQHRWSAGEKFDSAKAAAPNALRSGLNQGYDQGMVWEKSERAQRAAGVESRTGDVTALYTDPKQAREVDEIASRIIRRIPKREYVGLVVAQGSRIVSADLFANSHLYSKLYEKVIRSHAVEVIHKRHTGSPSQAQVRGFLNRVHGARSRLRKAPTALGHIRTFSGNGIGGEALEFDLQCIHVALFPQIMRPMPVPMPRPTPRPERR